MPNLTTTQSRLADLGIPRRITVGKGFGKVDFVLVLITGFKNRVFNTPSSEEFLYNIYDWLVIGPREQNLTLKIHGF